MRNSEVEKIIKTVEIFVEGLRVLDYDLISESFFKDGISCGSFKGKIHHVRREHWKEMREQRLERGEEIISEKASYSIRSINIVGNAASVIMDLTFGTKEKITERYVEFYHLVKVEKKWIIVSKVFPTNPELRLIE